MTKRFFLTIDIIIQTILISIDTWLVIFLIFNPNNSIGEFFLLLLATQFFLGAYQLLISSNLNLTVTFYNPRIKKYRRWHRAISWAYIAVLFLAIPISMQIGNAILGILFYVFVPQIVAYTYFVLSLTDWQDRGKLIQKYNMIN